MKKTEVLFFFDTEDFTSEECADAIKREADICTAEGVTGHFAVVGLLAKQLKHWGRGDVIHSLKPHIIGTHTYGHSMHPDICEVSDCTDFHEAVANVAYYEDQALDMIRDVLAPQDILFACPPGNSKSYAAMYYYADKGIPFYCDTVVHDSKGSVVYYCNQEHINYYQAMEGVFFSQDWSIDAFIEGMYAARDRAIVYTHPNIAVKKEFWDILNYDKVNIRPFGDWIKSPDRDKGETEKFYRDMQELIHKLKHDERFVITDLREILANRSERTVLTRDMLPGIKEKLEEKFYPVYMPSYSLSDIFYAAVDMLGGKDAYVPGAVYGFLSEPFGVKEGCTVCADGLKRAAACIDTKTFIPEKITVDGIDIGPADFLMAALEVLTTDKQTVQIMPKQQLVFMQDYDELNTFRLKGTWRHSDDFEDRCLSDRLRLQCWTFRNE